MLNKYTFLSIFITFFTTIQTLTAQTDIEFVKNNAIETENFYQLPQIVFNQLKHFKILMVGEMHGTREPAELLIGLTQLLTDNNDSVMVGFEIPSIMMQNSYEKDVEKNVLDSYFFKMTPIDGRANLDWAKAIVKVINNPKAQIFFFDINGGDYDKRDSLMYVNIKEKMVLNPNKKIITISGNLHNRLTEYKNQKKAAYYLLADSDLKLSSRICSFNHIYQNGSMLNNTGDGLKLHKIQNVETIYSKATEFEKYLLLLPSKNQQPYNAYYFSRTVTSADLPK